MHRVSPLESVLNCLKSTILFKSKNIGYLNSPISDFVNVCEAASNFIELNI